jgi:hypothetical protein
MRSSIMQPVFNKGAKIMFLGLILLIEVGIALIREVDFTDWIGLL